MKVLVQWALADPTDYLLIDVGQQGNAARRWLNLAKKAEPTDASTLDSNPGWVFDLVIDGVHFYGFDHVAGEPIAGGGLRFYGWNDDLDDPENNYRWGEVWEFHPHRFDVRFGQMNTHQVKRIYSEDLDDIKKFGYPQETTGGPVEFLPWSQWVMPPENLTRHGIWVRDETLWRRHFEVRRPVSWRDW